MTRFVFENLDDRGDAPEVARAWARGGQAWPSNPDRSSYMRCSETDVLEPWFVSIAGAGEERTVYGSRSLEKLVVHMIWLRGGGPA